MGYGFGDTHINRVIGKAVNEADLKLAIMTRDRTKLLGDLRKRDDCEGILKGMRYIYEQPLREIYPANQSFTLADEAFQREFFGNVIRR